MFVRKYINTESPKVCLDKESNIPSIGDVAIKVVNAHNKQTETELIKSLFELSKKEQKYIREIVIIDESEFRDFLNTMLPIYYKMKEGKE